MDFTQRLPILASGQTEYRKLDGLLPALQLLADDDVQIRKALLNQFTSLVKLGNENFGDSGYASICKVVFPLLDKLIHDKDESVRDRAIQVVAEMRTVVREDEKEHIMKLTLDMAHDLNEKLRESAVKLLNEMAQDMG